MIVPHARHWSAPERRSTRTVCHLSEMVECRSPRFLTSLVESSPNAKLLPAAIAGSVDAISFLRLGGLFIAHAKGNLVIAAGHLGSGGEAAVAPMQSVPVFVAALGLTRLLAVACSCCSLAFLSCALPSVRTQRRRSLRARSASRLWPCRTHFYRSHRKGRRQRRP
jgi:Protein of unknown function (DUF1275)